MSLRSLASHRLPLRRAGKLLCASSIVLVSAGCLAGPQPGQVFNPASGAPAAQTPAAPAATPTPAPTTTAAPRPAPAPSVPTTAAPTTTVAPVSGVLWSTSFDVAGSGVSNGMVLPSFGPHLTPRAGVVSNGAIYRDPNMTEWEDVLLRAPIGPLSGNRFIEAVVTVASNGGDAHPAIMFFDDPGTFSGGCAGGSTMDWAEVDPWNNGQAGRISFVRDGCYDASSHVFAGVMGAYQTYTVRAEIVGSTLTMKVNGVVTASAQIPAGLSLPYAGLRIGQYGVDGGYGQYRIESFAVGTL